MKLLPLEQIFLQPWQGRDERCVEVMILASDQGVDPPREILSANLTLLNESKYKYFIQQPFHSRLRGENSSQISLASRTNSFQGYFGHFSAGLQIRHNIKNVQLSLHMFFCIHHRLLLCVFCHYGIVWLDNIRCKVGNLEKLSRCYVNDVWTCWVFAGISNISPITQYKQPRLASTHMQERLKKLFSMYLVKKTFIGTKITKNKKTMLRL